MFTKTATILIATLGLLLSVGDSATAKPTCCAKKAYCCSVKLACCGKTAVLEKAVGDNVTAASELNAQPTCCIKHAYCCSVNQPCCKKGSASIGEVTHVDNPGESKMAN